MLQQRLLARGAASLRCALLVTAARTLAVHAPPPRAYAPAGRRTRRVTAAALLEAALMEQEFRRAGRTPRRVLLPPHASPCRSLDGAASRLGLCCDALRFDVRVCGALGLRTVHQVDPKAQLTLVVNVDPEAETEAEAGGAQPPLPATGRAHRAAAPPAPADGRASALLGESVEESDVLHAPALVAEAAPPHPCPNGCDASPAPLPPPTLPSLEQAVVLALALGVRKGRAPDELRAWEVAPFTEAVRAQPRGAFAVRAAADVVASRHERGRSRTRVRALSSLEALVAATEEASTPAEAARRCVLVHAAWLPPRSSLKRELAELLLSAGLVGEAMATFEALHLWDALIVCLQLAGKRAEASALARRCLDARPGDARLWCALGDATGDEAHYRTGVEVGGRTGGGGRKGVGVARAHRSLARAAAARSDWPSAASSWSASLATNPLAPDGWFGLGFASMRAGDDATALSAFSRVTQQEPDNGEAWNNVAALSLKAGRTGAALAALGECVKHKRDAWRVWDNLATVAAQAGAWQQAAHAATTVLTLTAGQQPPGRDVVEGVSRHEPARAAALCKAAASSPAVAASPWFWRAYAQLMAAADDEVGAAECSARELRALAGGPWDKERPAFEEYAACVARLASGRLASGDLAGARMLLRGALKRAAPRFEDTPPWAEMNALLAKVTATEVGAAAAALGQEGAASKARGE